MFCTPKEKFEGNDSLSSQSVPKQPLKSAVKGIKFRQGQGQNNAGMLTVHSRKTKAETFQFYYRTNSVKSLA